MGSLSLVEPPGVVGCFRQQPVAEPAFPRLKLLALLAPILSDGGTTIGLVRII